MKDIYTVLQTFFSFQRKGQDLWSIALQMENRFKIRK